MLKKRIIETIDGKKRLYQLVFFLNTSNYVHSLWFG